MSSVDAEVTSSEAWMKLLVARRAMSEALDELPLRDGEVDCDAMNTLAGVYHIICEAADLLRDAYAPEK